MIEISSIQGVVLLTFALVMGMYAMHRMQNSDGPEPIESEGEESEGGGFVEVRWASDGTLLWSGQPVYLPDPGENLKIKGKLYLVKSVTVEYDPEEGSPDLVILVE
jgi:hypothetical protein